MKISQREARRLRKRVDVLEAAIEAQRRTYAQEWFRATNIWTISCDPSAYAAIHTAKLLRHGVVVQLNESRPNELMLMALPQAEAK